MNEYQRTDCERFEALLASWFDDGLSAADRRDVEAHVAVCASCRESLSLVEQMEAALVARRDDVPAVDAFLPAFAPARPRFAHPRLVAAFRTFMSPAGIAIVLVIWSTMLAFRYRDAIASVFQWSTPERFSTLLGGVSTSLLGVSGGDPYTLIAIYVLLTLLVLGSTGAITLRYIRHS